MATINEIAKQLEEALIEFAPVVLDYGKDKVVGFPNETGSSDLVIFIKKDEMIMNFGFQNISRKREIYDKFFKFFSK